MTCAVYVSRAIFLFHFLNLPRELFWISDSASKLWHSTDTIFFCKVGEFLAYMPLRLSIGTDKDQP